jgi:hypothetical protein
MIRVALIKSQLKAFYFIVLVVIAIMIASPSYGSVSKKSHNKILMLSGLTDQIEQFPELIKLGMQEIKS